MPTTPAPEDDLAYLEQTLQRGQEAMRRLRDAQAEILEVVGRAGSVDGLMKASSDGRGGIMEIRFAPRAMRLDHVTFGRQVTAVLQAAQQEAEKQTQEITDRALADTDMPEPLDETFIRDRVEQIARDLL